MIYLHCVHLTAKRQSQGLQHTHTHHTDTPRDTHTHMLIEGDSSRTLAKPRQMLWPFRMTKLVFGQRRLPTQIVWSLIGNSQCSCPAARTAMLCGQAANCKGRAHSSLHLSACLSLPLFGLIIAGSSTNSSRRSSLIFIQCQRDASAQRHCKFFR